MITAFTITAITCIVILLTLNLRLARSNAIHRDTIHDLRLTLKQKEQYLKDSHDDYMKLFDIIAEHTCNQ